MTITKERSRLIFEEYQHEEKQKLEDLVGTMDKVFTYEDTQNKKIFLPTGIMGPVQKLFPNIRLIDNSANWWPHAHSGIIEHSAEPRNQMQKDVIEFTLDNAQRDHKVGLVLGPGTGKAEPVSRKIPTPTPQGFTRMGDLKIGDMVFDHNGKPTEVTGVYDQGTKDIYKITFNDGRTAQCCKEHLWNVFPYWTRVQKTVTLESMLDDYKIYSPKKVRSNERGDGNRDPYLYRYRIPVLSSPVQYNHVSVPVDPYVVGAFLGDGCCKEYPLSFSSGSGFIPDKIAKICGFMVRRSSERNHTHIFYDMYDGAKRVITREFFKEVPELVGTGSHDKYIPDVYLYNSLDVRMELLRGLMDTDGSITYAEGRYHVRFSSSSKKLLDQVQELVRGLGFEATFSPDKREWRYQNGFHGSLLFKIPNRIKPDFFHHPEKHYQATKAASIKQIQQPYEYLIIKDIQLIKREKARCISVASPDKLYLTQNYIVTHNTFMGCYSALRVGLRTLIITPTNNIKIQWAETLTGMFKVPEERVLLVNTPRQFAGVNADFVIVSQSSLGSLNREYDLERIMMINKFGIKIIDEAHMFFHNIIKVDGSSNIRHNWYLTATFGRSADEEDRLYQQMFGDIKIFRVANKVPTVFNRKPGDVYGQKPHMNVFMCWGSSGLTPEQKKKVSSSMRYSDRAGKWMRYGVTIPGYTNVVIPADGTMTKFLRQILDVIKMAQQQVRYGRMLVLTPTIDSVETVAHYVSQMFPKLRIGTIHSRNKKEANNEAKASADIMISTVKSAGTGFDVKDLSKLVVAEQFKSWILADQVSGRLRRRPDGKDTYMWDIVDADMPQLRAWANARANVLKKKAKLFKVIDLE